MTDQIRAPWTPERKAAACGDGVDLEISDEHEPGVAHGCPEGCPVHCWGGPDVPDDIPYPAWATSATDGIDTPGCDCGHDGMGPGWHVSCSWRQQVRQWVNGQQRAQGDPHAPQDGPEAPDAGAETPDGAGGRQTGAEPLARLRRLRDQLAAEHAKAVRADQQPRPDLDHLRVTAHNGIAAGLEIGLFFVDHHLREVGEGSSSTADSLPGEQHATRAAAIRDQAALAQIRLHLAAHRARLQYADPILLGRIEAVLRQVGELEAAGGGALEKESS